MSSGKRIALSFAVAIAMLVVNAVLVARDAPLGARFAAASAIGVVYAVALVAWERRAAGRGR